ncbi:MULTISPECIES: phage virion morphogenesis protein [Vibrio]|uniref:Phage virion morphogenesis protein n=2 Tax=Vibrio TaxID=662 RepID=A0A2N7NH64_9VIBR|nr:phage virion morphogenesis protein [Vibrio tasmaniensis]PMP13758.1 phage virion morphogenesis protein [Vibrio tasmaniensis]TKG28476.1 phage virion morphogenesis protein [Vibrio tasmaniensis]TKG39078.1 phage virion morphogenesis protein [Vibrio tasmaniensis]TKG42323.1 phage virion morphogenesis protein [Vibrio tasmaniensis]TKG54912.1 phage virion morphogenesis protein [Vibrio tasmaniensis]
MIKVQWDEKGVLRTDEILKALAMPATKRERLLRRVAKEVQKISKRNITKQQSPDGKAWKARRNKRKGKSKKMLTGFKKLIYVSGNKDAAKVSVGKGSYRIHGAYVANFHQQGHRRKANKDNTPTGRETQLSDTEMCTKGQAKALRNIGYEVYARRINPKAKRGSKRVPTIKWMTQNLTQYEVKGAFKKLRELGLVRIKSSWEIVVPPRKFLGATRQSLRKAWTRAFQGIDYGWKVQPKHLRRG